MYACYVVNRWRVDEFLIVCLLALSLWGAPCDVFPASPASRAIWNCTRRCHYANGYSRKTVTPNRLTYVFGSLRVFYSNILYMRAKLLKRCSDAVENHQSFECSPLTLKLSMCQLPTSILFTVVREITLKFFLILKTVFLILRKTSIIYSH